MISTTSQATNSIRALLNVAACQLEENSLDSRLCIRQLLKARITSNPAVELLHALYFHLA